MLVVTFVDLGIDADGITIVKNVQDAQKESCEMKDNKRVNLVCMC